MQPASLDIWDTKYRLKTNKGYIVDKEVKDTLKRVAKFLSRNEKEKDKREKEMLWALENGAIPAGRIISNAGAGEHKPNVSMINCTVSGIIEDSINGIFNANKDAAATLSAGCGIGYEFSTIRPNGAMVSGAGATTTGALPFMDVFDKMCFTISSSGGRRGAQMATFDIEHPDVLNFIKAKREDGKFRQFNLSLLITDKFINAVNNDEEWIFSFPVTKKEFSEENSYIWREFSGNKDNYIVDDKTGNVACNKYSTIKAVELWDIIMRSTYEFSEPGFILIDNVNKMNNNWFCEKIRKTNPCGEQPLPPHGACLLGSINLTKFVVNPFTDKAYFDFEKYRKVIRIFTRMLDNVVDDNNLPLKEQQDEITSKRRHGMGYLGLGSAMVMLGYDYGDDESLLFTGLVTKNLVIEGWKEGVELAKEKGAAPILLSTKKYKEHDNKTGIELFCESKHLERVFKVEPELKGEMLKHGCRFTHHSSIAPTGTISLSMGNNCSNGIEPSFSHFYSRNVIREGKKTKEKMDVYSHELLMYKELIDNDVDIKKLPDVFKGADDFTPKQHVDVQSAAQYWIDSSISKTINVPTEIDFDKFKDIYSYAIEKGLKGCTTFRFNPEVFQGVLVKEEDLKNTEYTFTLDSGEEVTLSGEKEVIYDGESHTVANLYDALKEGYYGKF